jgi:hypothetical protein
MKGKRCTFLVPVAYNDGRQIEPEIIIDIKRTLDRRFDGYTVKGPFEGSWKGQVELMMEYSVVVPPRRIDELRDTVKVILRELGQQAMYFEVHDSHPEIQSLVDEIEDGGAEQASGVPKVKKEKRKPAGRKKKRGDTNA